jgi:hypothetical protein
MDTDKRKRRKVSTKGIAFSPEGETKFVLQKRYVCFICSKTYKSEGTRRAHIRSTLDENHKTKWHELTAGKCSGCERDFKNSRALKAHQKHPCIRGTFINMQGETLESQGNKGCPSDELSAAQRPSTLSGEAVQVDVLEKSSENSSLYHMRNEDKIVFTNTFPQKSEDSVGYPTIDSMAYLDTTMPKFIMTNAFAQQFTATGRGGNLAAMNTFPWPIRYEEDGLSTVARAEDWTMMNAFPWPGHGYGEGGLSNTRTEDWTMTNAFPWPGHGYGEGGLPDTARAEDWTTINTLFWP